MARKQNRGRGRHAQDRREEGRVTAGPSVAVADELADTATARLDHVETLAPGAGYLDLWGGVRGSSERGFAGAGIDYEHRISERLAAFGRGTIGYHWDPFERGWEAEALAGLRMRF